VQDPAADLARLTFLDERVEAHLDGLRLAGEPGWEACTAALAEGEPGAVFTAGVLCAERPEPDRALLETAAAEPRLARAFVSALGWSPFPKVRALVHELLAADGAPDLQYLGLAACAVHREDPGPALAAAVSSSHARLRARALRAVGELGRDDLLEALRDGLRASDEPVRFAACWAGAIFDDASAREGLWALAVDGGPFATRACAMAMRRAPPATAAPALVSLGTRAALAGAAALGDPSLIPWLLEQTEVPGSARRAGWAVSTITGIDLTRQKATRSAPEDFSGGPTDDPEDERVAMDADASLPWPEPVALRAIWQAEQGRFKQGTRYLLGERLTPAHLDKVLRSGAQPARAAAAIELRLAQNAGPIFEVRARGSHQ
jgi:uncharacterized protein (TIGR02270 family)